jgi:hypothetical protein
VNLEEDSPRPLDPFFRGLLWGVIITLTVSISATLGATATYTFPSLFETIQTIYKNTQE